MSQRGTTAWTPAPGFVVMKRGTAAPPGQGKGKIPSTQPPPPPAQPPETRISPVPVWPSFKPTPAPAPAPAQTQTQTQPRQSPRAQTQELAQKPQAPATKTTNGKEEKIEAKPKPPLALTAPAPTTPTVPVWPSYKPPPPKPKSSAPAPPKTTKDGNEKQQQQPPKTQQQAKEKAKEKAKAKVMELEREGNGKVKGPIEFNVGNAIARAMKKATAKAAPQRKAKSKQQRRKQLPLASTQVGARKKKLVVVLKDPQKKKRAPLTKLKKAILRERNKRRQGDALPLDKPKALKHKEMKALAMSLPPLQCKWPGCAETFLDWKQGLQAFREHIVEHARKDSREDLECLWEGCGHQPFMKMRSLRLHVVRHAKSNRKPPPAIWTNDRLDVLSKTARIPVVDLATELGLPFGKGIDDALSAALPELNRLQARLRNNPIKAGMRQRIVVGLRQTLRDVKCGRAKFVMIARRIEGDDTAGGPLSQVKEIVSTAKAKDIPVAAVLSRRKIGKLLKSEGSKRMKFGVTALAIISSDGAGPTFRTAVELTSEFKPAVQQQPLSPLSFGSSTNSPPAASAKKSDEQT